MKKNPESLQALELNDQEPRNKVFNDLVRERTKESYKKKWSWQAIICNNNKKTFFTILIDTESWASEHIIW